MKLITTFLAIPLKTTIQNKQTNALKYCEIVLVDFRPELHLEWQIINDGVMGGISESTFKINNDQTADFAGMVSLENNGGFASVRALLQELVTGNFQKIVLRVKGDGKKYSLRLRTNANFDGAAYACNFLSVKDEWTEFAFSTKDFIPTFRGRTLQNVTPLNESEIRQIGFLISDHQSGSFNLKIEWVKVLL